MADPVPPAHILVVEDEASLRLFLEHILGRHYRVTLAEDGQEALEALGALEAGELPDLILTDVMMPRLDGFGLLKAVRGDPRTHHIPVVMLSALSGDEARIGSIEAGAEDYLVKPVSARELRARVRTHLETARQARHRELDLRHQAEQARLSLETVLAGISDAFGIIDENWRLTYLNERAAAMAGQPREELLGRQLWELFPEAVGNRLYHELCHARAEGLEVRQEFLARRRGHWYEVRAYPNGDGGLTIFALDITDRKRLEARLRDQTKRLVEADRRKDEFLAMLGHELRNPLAPIRSALDLLELQDSLGETADWALGMIDRQVRQITRLVDDLLDVARITRGRVELRLRPLDLGRLVFEAVDGIQPLITARQQRLLLDLPTPAPWVQADGERLVQVMGNLLDNAAKYSEPGRSIQLTVTAEEGEAVIRIRDQGCGIPQETLPYVFDPFTQGRRSLDRSQGGIGLGLTLVKRLVELHGGRVGVQSGSGGSTFTVCLPLIQAGDRPTRPALPTRKTLPRRRVLVVEDNPAVAQSLARLLDSLGQTVEAVGDGESALRILERFKPELVLLDIGLPGLDGYQTAQAIRRLIGAPREGSPPLRLVALTGYGAPDDLRQSRQAGFDRHLLKPVSLDSLRDLLGEGADPPAVQEPPPGRG